MAKILCKHCLKIHDREYECDAKSKYKRDKNRCRKNSMSSDKKIIDRFYSTSEWRKCREEMMKEANYLCEMCLEFGKITYNDLHVHHVVKVKDNWNKRIDKDNLIVVCPDCHRQIEDMTTNEIIRDVEKLKAELKRAD